MLKNFAYTLLFTAVLAKVSNKKLDRGAVLAELVRIEPLCFEEIKIAVGKMGPGKKAKMEKALGTVGPLFEDAVG